MGGPTNPDRPCPHCAGKGVVVVKNATTGRESELPCPVCRGSKKSDGIVRK